MRKSPAKRTPSEYQLDNLIYKLEREGKIMPDAEFLEMFLAGIITEAHGEGPKCTGDACPVNLGGEDDHQ